MNAMKRSACFLILCAGLGAAAPSPAAEPAAPWTDPRAIRDAARAIKSEPVSDIRAFLDRCRTELPGPAGSFDPHYDPDVERELRRRDAQAARKGRGASDGYVSWTEVSKWAPTNDVQLALRELGGDFRVVAYPDAGHNARDAAWRDESVWDWLFSKRRATRSPRNEPHAEGAEFGCHAESAEGAE